MSLPDYLTSLEGPAIGVLVITPSNTANLAGSPRAIWVGGAGDVAVEMIDGSTGVLAGILAGTLMPVRVRKVLATGTTATGLVGLI
jgi:ethanolamine utilization microcompartment shell protein EutS